MLSLLSGSSSSSGFSALDVHRPKWSLWIKCWQIRHAELIAMSCFTPEYQLLHSTLAVPIQVSVPFFFFFFFRPHCAFLLFSLAAMSVSTFGIVVGNKRELGRGHISAPYTQGQQPLWFMIIEDHNGQIELQPSSSIDVTCDLTQINIHFYHKHPPKLEQGDEDCPTPFLLIDCDLSINSLIFLSLLPVFSTLAQIGIGQGQSRWLLKRNRQVKTALTFLDSFMNLVYLVSLTLKLA